MEHLAIAHEVTMNGGREFNRKLHRLVVWNS
jgi:hypothetical protein